HQHLRRVSAHSFLELIERFYFGGAAGGVFEGGALSGFFCSCAGPPGPPVMIRIGGRPTISSLGTNVLSFSSPRPRTKSPTLMSGSVMLSPPFLNEVFSSTSMSCVWPSGRAIVSLVSL